MKGGVVMTATIELERIIKIIERVEDKEALKEIYEWLKDNDLMGYIPRQLWPKLFESLGSEPMTPEEIKAVEEALDDETIPHEEIKKEFGL